MRGCPEQPEEHSLYSLYWNQGCPAGFKEGLQAALKRD